MKNVISWAYNLAAAASGTIVGLWTVVFLDRTAQQHIYGYVRPFDYWLYSFSDIPPLGIAAGVIVGAATGVIVG